MRPRLFWQTASAEARRRLSYRADFWISSVAGFFVKLVICWFIVEAVFRESGSDQVAGFTARGMTLYYVAVILVAKLVQSTEMEQSVSQDIYEGGLSKYLIYPAPYLFVKYAQQIGSLAPALAQVALFGAVAPVVIGPAPDVEISPATVAMAAAAVAAANLLNFLITWPIQAIAFWADNVWSLMVAHRFIAALLGGLLVPLGLFPEAARRVLELLPFRYLFAFPVEVLFGRVGPGGWVLGMAVSLAWCAAIGVAGNIVWRRGDLRYTGVGI